jgi:carboxyl-terminal processing protease
VPALASRLATTALLGALLTACARPSAPARVTPAPAPERPSPPAIEPLATFDSAWTIIGRTHWDTTYNGVDWAALRDSLRPRAAAATTQRELRGVLQQLVGSLRQSHFDIIPQEVADVATGTEQRLELPRTAQVGLTTRWSKEGVVITHVLPGSAADRAGIRTGWLLDVINDDTLAVQLARLPQETDPRRVMLSAYRLSEGGLRGAPGSTLTLELRDGANRRQTRTLDREPIVGQEVKYGNLPAQLASLRWERRQIGNKRIGIIQFDIWMPVLAREFDLAMDSLRDSDGLVIDLRGNFGGVAGMAMGIGGHLVDSAVPVGRMITRSQTIKFTMNPRRVSTANQRVEPFGGPVALVVDALSVSTSEIFAGGLQDLSRVRVFGEQTAGQALPAVAGRLPNGDILYHAIANFVGPTGRSMEGDGVIPDERVVPERSALLDGRDPAVDAAVSWAATAPRPGAGTKLRVSP